MSNETEQTVDEATREEQQVSQHNVANVSNVSYTSASTLFPHNMDVINVSVNDHDVYFNLVLIHTSLYESAFKLFLGSG